MKLWPFQREAVRAYKKASEEHKRVVLVLPTGGGKTVVAVAIIRWKLGIERWADIAGTKKRVLFLAMPREQVEQAVARLVEWGVPEEAIGTILAGDDRANPDAPIQVATLASFLSRKLRKEDIPPADLIVIDECHHAAARSYLRVLALYPDADVLGLTATPERYDGKGLADAGFTVILTAATTLRLGIEGYLTLPRMWGPGETARVDLKGVPVLAGDYNMKVAGKRMSRNAIIGRHVSHYEEHGGGRSAVVYACGKLHAKKIARRFRKAGYNVELLFGDTPLEERRRILRRLDRAEKVIVVTVLVLTEGWDCRAAKVCILARPTRSWTLYMQMIGRFLRPWNGVVPVILDHAGNRLRHGPPEQEREFRLVTRKKPRSAEPAPEKECPECGTFVATGSKDCPECGHEFALERVPEEKAGTLVEYVATPEEKAATLDVIRRIAKERGADEEWVRKVYALRFHEAS